MTLLITHSACLEHLTPPGHPERSAVAAGHWARVGCRPCARAIEDFLLSRGMSHSRDLDVFAWHSRPREWSLDNPYL